MNYRPFIYHIKPLIEALPLWGIKHELIVMTYGRTYLKVIYPTGRTVYVDNDSIGFYIDDIDHRLKHRYASMDILKYRVLTGDF